MVRRENQEPCQIGTCKEGRGRGHGSRRFVSNEKLGSEEVIGLVTGGEGNWWCRKDVGKVGR